jgi:hypothetical protein
MATQPATPHTPAVAWLCDGCRQPCDVENLSRLPDQSLRALSGVQAKHEGAPARTGAPFDHEDVSWRDMTRREEFESNEDYRRHHGDY